MATVGYQLPWQPDLPIQNVWQQVMHVPGELSKNKQYDKKVINENPISCQFNIFIPNNSAGKGWQLPEIQHCKC